MNASWVKREKEGGDKHKPARTILVVEDIDETRLMMRLVLELSGYCVLEAVDGQEAIEVARRERPDLIIMDIGLPVVDGLTATRLIREEAGSAEVPIVAVTARGTAECRVKALAAGCDEYVTKPINFDQLGTLLKRLLP